MRRLLHRPAWRYGFLAMVVVLLLGSASLVAFRLVQVKMLPFDNKSEFQVMVDMPEGSTLEQTAAATREIGNVVAAVPEVMNYQMYVGTSSPYNFNGLVRHYFLRRGANVADLQVNLVPKGERKAQSHDIAKRVRPAIQTAAARYGANVKVSEVPPGPPVLQTLVAEVYGPDYPGQIEVARKIKGILSKTEGVVDVDWYVEDDQPRYRFEVDQEKAALNGISTEQVAETLRLAVDGTSAGLLHRAGEKEDVPIVLRLPRRRAVEAGQPESGPGDGTPGKSRAPRRVGAGEGGDRREEHLPQEPDARGVRDRRRRREGGEPRVRHPVDRQGT